jgi:hypothetical protein
MEFKRIKGIKRIIIPASAQPNGGTGETIQLKGKGKGKRRKQSKGLKLFEKVARRSGRSGTSVFDQYLKRHKRSNRKKKDGWLKDLAKNTFNASRKGRKDFKLSTLF